MPAAVQGVGALAAALRNHGSLSSLELGYNPLGPDGTKTVVDLAKFGLPKVGGGVAQKGHLQAYELLSRRYVERHTITVSLWVF